MAVERKIESIRVLIDAYGIGVRGGVLTPCAEDEAAFRKMMKLPDMPKNVAAEWGRAKGVRLPITLQRGLADPIEQQGGENNEQD
jgi:hypothetical protein